jgi:hypothetical protein
VTDASIGNACEVNGVPGTFTWVQSTPTSNIWFMGCDLNPA